MEDSLQHGPATQQPWGEATCPRSHPACELRTNMVGGTKTPGRSLGLEAPGKVRYRFTRVHQLPTISPGGVYFSVAGAVRAWCGRRVRSVWGRRRCRLVARSVAGLCLWGVMFGPVFC